MYNVPATFYNLFISLPGLSFSLSSSSSDHEVMLASARLVLKYPRPEMEASTRLRRIGSQGRSRITSSRLRASRVTS